MAASRDQRMGRERTILEEVIETDPKTRLTIEELILSAASDPDSLEEADEIKLAVRELRRSGLIRYRNGEEILEATPAALAAFEILTA